MTALSAEVLGGQNVAAFMDMIAFAEGTDNGRQKTRDRGYDVIVGGQLFDGYADHPRILVPLPRYGIKSSAAGRYQMIRKTWEWMAGLYGLTDFSPESQDRACLGLLRYRGALQLIQRGDFYGAVHAARKEWASLPGAGYGQKEQRIDALRDVYVAKGGQLLECRA